MKLYVKSSGRVAMFMVVPRRPPVPLWLWIFDKDIPTKRAQKKSQNITGNLDMVNTTYYMIIIQYPSQFCSRRQKPAGSHHKEEKKRWSIDRRRNRGEVADLGLTVMLNGPYSPMGKKWRPRAPGGIMPR